MIVVEDVGGVADDDRGRLIGVVARRMQPTAVEMIRIALVEHGSVPSIDSVNERESTKYSSSPEWRMDVPCVRAGAGAKCSILQKMNRRAFT